MYHVKDEESITGYSIAWTWATSQGLCGITLGVCFLPKPTGGACVMLVYKASEQQYCVSADRQTA